MTNDFVTSLISLIIAFFTSKVGNIALIDAALICSYIGLCLIIGLKKMKGVQSIQDYALGDRKLSTAALVATIYATYLGAGSTIGTIEKIGMVGVLFMVTVLLNPIKWLFVMFVFGRNIEKFYGCLTLSDIMARLYGSTGQLITSIATIANAIGTVAAQTLALGHLMHYFLGISIELGVLVSIGVLIFYSVTGGARAVVMTDVLQAGIFYIAFPILAVILLHKLNGWDHVYSLLPQEKWQLGFEGDKLWIFSGFMLYALLDGSSGPYIQRFLMSSNTQQLMKSLRIVAIIDTTIVLLLCVCSLVIVAHITDTIDHSNVLWHLIDNHVPYVAKGIVIIGFLAVIMSTADSWLNTAGVTVSHDILKQFYPNMSEKAVLAAARLATFAVGGLSIALALTGASVIEIIWLVITFYNPLIFVPLVAGFLGFRTNSHSYVVSVIIAFLFTMLGAALEQRFDALSLLLGLIGSTMGLFGMHYWQKTNGTLTEVSQLQVNTPKPTTYGTILASKWRKTKHLNWKDALSFSYKGVELCRPQYHQFGILGLLYCLFPLLVLLSNSRQPALGTALDYVDIIIRIIGATGCIVILMCDTWEHNFRAKYFPIIWHIVLLWCFPLLGAYNLLVHNSDTLSLYTIIASFVLAVFVDARSFVILMTLGSLMGTFFYALTSSTLHGAINMSAFAYALLVIIIAFIMRRNQEVDSNRMKIMSVAIAHEVRSPMAAAYDGTGMLVDAINRAKIISPVISPDEFLILQVSRDDYELIQYFKDNIQSVLDKGMKTAQTILMSLSGMQQAQDYGEYSALKTVSSAIGSYDLTVTERKRVMIMPSQDFTFHGSYKLFQHVIQNLVSNAIRYAGPEAEISICTGGQSIYIRDNGKGISPDDVPHIFEPYYTKEKGGTGLGLAFCKIVVSGMRGTITCKSELGQFTEFAITLPVVPNNAA